MKKFTLKFLFGALALLYITHCATTPNLKTLATPRLSPAPKRIMILVFDQLRPDFIERFHLKHFIRLQNEGISFPNAVVGHLSSVTVVSHPVITTGLFPKHLPWQDEFFRDDHGKLGAKGDYYSALDLEPNQYKTLLKDTDNVSLLTRVSNEAKHTYVIGQKPYAVMGMGAPLKSSVITLSSKLKSPPGWRQPSGFDVPSYFLKPFLGRFYLDCNSTYGSENSLYPFDGQRFAPGVDPHRLGGDAWVADGVTNIMDNDPEWKAVFATFGSIDKILHALAEHEIPTEQEWAIKHQLTLKDTLERADQALGSILDKLAEKSYLEDTLLIVTADHGGQANSHFYGLSQPGLGTNYLFFAKTKNQVNLEIPHSLSPILKSKDVAAMTHDSALKIWTHYLSRTKLSELAAQVSQLPGVAEVYTLNKTSGRYHYIRTFHSKELIGRPLQWSNSHHQDLLETLVNPSAPNIVALLLEGHGYGLPGDHGGTQEWVQRIPLLIRSPNIPNNLRGSLAPDEVRLVDINPIASKLLGLPLPSGLDGSSRAITRWVR